MDYRSYDQILKVELKVHFVILVKFGNRPQIFYKEYRTNYHDDKVA